jgi:hypothetical protein
MVNKVGYHTFDECKCKVAGIKSLLEQICRISEDNDTIRAVSESAIQMCDELLVEGNSDNGNRHN